MCRLGKKMRASWSFSFCFPVKEVDHLTIWYAGRIDSGCEFGVRGIA